MSDADRIGAAAPPRVAAPDDPMHLTSPHEYRVR